MIVFTPEAAEQVEALIEHYEALDRPEALRGLMSALESGWRKMRANPSVGLSAPRPYPQLARPGHRWIKAGRYWIAYSNPGSAAIVGVFYETANIPRRI